MKKPRVSARKRERLLEEFEQSGMSAAAFSRQRGINYTTFHSWRRRIKTAKKTSRPRLVEVEMEPAPSGTVELRVGSLARLEIRSPEQVRIAARLIRELEEGSC